MKGITLAERLKSGPIPIEESLNLALQIAEALEAAHEKGVIHRDLKPANIKVTPDGKVKVLDFGLAKVFAKDQEEMILSESPTLTAAATRQGIILGTAPYMSPEQALGERMDTRSDIFSFGIVLYEMLSGTQPFQRQKTIETLTAILRDAPPPLQAKDIAGAPALLDILNKAMAKCKAERYQSMKDMKCDLQAFRDDLLRGQRSGRMIWILSAGAILVFALAFLIWWLVDRDPLLVRPSPKAHSNEIAVLPFEDMSPDSTNKWLGRGISEEILNNLSHIKDLKVVARTSSFQARLQSMDVRDIGRQLNVDYILEGSVRRSGERSKYPPAKPGALLCEPLKAAMRGR